MESFGTTYAFALDSSLNRKKDYLEEKLLFLLQQTERPKNPCSNIQKGGLIIGSPHGNISGDDDLSSLNRKKGYLQEKLLLLLQQTERPKKSMLQHTEGGLIIGFPHGNISGDDDLSSNQASLSADTSNPNSPSNFLDPDTAIIRLKRESIEYDNFAKQAISVFRNARLLFSS
ncbi:hypothetical protein CDAR_57481 [Caerostris darwini]|uniref:Uncharacterized protein n=1 Tax=Caerostris darwini TaxID=1538125 RepID=A0AAV4STX9_9ARAC|nr:hypothetical protein CDAR_57481 [Caerostris darwini]